MQQMYVANKGVLINEKQEILLVCDAGLTDHVGAEDRWDVPGGRMDQGEEILEGLERELREEIGTCPDLSQARPFFVGKWGVGGDKENQPIAGIFWRIPVSGDLEITLSEEHKAFRWVPLNNIPEEARNESLDLVLGHLRTFRLCKCAH